MRQGIGQRSLSKPFQRLVKKSRVYLLHLKLVFCKQQRPHSPMILVVGEQRSIPETDQWVLAVLPKRVKESAFSLGFLGRV